MWVNDSVNALFRVHKVLKEHKDLPVHESDKEFTSTF